MPSLWFASLSQGAENGTFDQRAASLSLFRGQHVIQSSPLFGDLKYIFRKETCNDEMGKSLQFSCLSDKECCRSSWGFVLAWPPNKTLLPVWPCIMHWARPGEVNISNFSSDWRQEGRSLQTQQQAVVCIHTSYVYTQCTWYIQLYIILRIACTPGANEKHSESLLQVLLNLPQAPSEAAQAQPCSK